MPTFEPCSVAAFTCRTIAALTASPNISRSTKSISFSAAARALTSRQTSFGNGSTSVMTTRDPNEDGAPDTTTLRARDDDRR
jgi:hypothetical protein